MKRIVLAFDSFKGCMSAHDACEAARQGVLSVCKEAEVVCLPLSDGGEGMVECLMRVLPLKEVRVTVHGPLMELHEACYSISEDGGTAYMEMAAASGLTLVPKEERNPLITTTYGVGEMLLDAVQRGCSHLVMGIGGSATCDAGKGMVDVLMPHLRRMDGKCLIDGKEVVISVASDVSNPLYGPEGAAYVFAPQKGATEEQVALLDERLRLFARQSEALGWACTEMAEAPGAGAAGGLGYALMAYLGGRLQSGIGLMLNEMDFDNVMRDAQMVITGEGKSDMQTLMGKVAHGVLERASRHHVPVVLLSGSIEDKERLLAAGFRDVISINQGTQLALAEMMKLEVASTNMRRTVADLMRKEWDD